LSERAAAEPRPAGELARRRAVGSSRWLAGALRAGASGDQPQPVNRTRGARPVNSIRGYPCDSTTPYGLCAISLA
jgi:hypothetical protein